MPFQSSGSRNFSFFVSFSCSFVVVLEVCLFVSRPPPGRAPGQHPKPAASLLVCQESLGRLCIGCRVLIRECRVKVKKTGWLNDKQDNAAAGVMTLIYMWIWTKVAAAGELRLNSRGEEDDRKCKVKKKNKNGKLRSPQIPTQIPAELQHLASACGDIALHMCHTHTNTNCISSKTYICI